jgi:hypothetical protein
MGLHCARRDEQPRGDFLVAEAWLTSFTTSSSACQRCTPGPCCLEVVVPHNPRATVNIVAKDDNLPSLLLNVSAVPLRT